MEINLANRINAVGSSSSVWQYFLGAKAAGANADPFGQARLEFGGAATVGKSFGSGLRDQQEPSQSGAPLGDPGRGFKSVVARVGSSIQADIAASARISPASYTLGENNLSAQQNALLKTISGAESGGKYNVLYGGDTFSSYSDHPRRNIPIISGPNVGKTSSAAGRYQIIQGTWDEYKNKLNLPDFSPASQDLAAWGLAQDTFKSKTGKDLEQVLSSADASEISSVGKALSSVWTSLPGGIEQRLGANEFVSRFVHNLKLSASPATLSDGLVDGGADTLAQTVKPLDASIASAPRVSSTERIETKLFRGLDGAGLGT